MTEPSDEQLLARFGRGDHGALGTLAARYEGLLLGLALGLLDGRAELARDAVQDSWVRVIRHVGGFAGQSTFKTWVYRIVINRCRDLRTQHAATLGRHEAHAAVATTRPDTPHDPVIAMHHAELNGRLRSALGDLPAHNRLMLLLCYHQGLTHTEAAEVLAIPVGTLKSRLNAALTELRGRLGLEEAR